MVKDDKLDNVLKELHTSFMDSDLYNDCTKQMPSRNEIVSILKDLRIVLFPGYFGKYDKRDYIEQSQSLIVDIMSRLRTQLEIVYCQSCKSNNKKIDDFIDRFIDELPNLQKMLMLDAEAIYNGDPAAESKAIVIHSYPGMLAIYTYRIAHIFYKNDIPMLPRMMTEYAHSRTGIDINAGAKIGKNFFIDHGTGIVIGETCEIGDNVKIYQGVTLGALSTKEGQDLRGKKRHPTIGNNVTIYSNATILGGETIIGDNSIIGGNTFITSSIAPNTRVVFEHKTVKI